MRGTIYLTTEETAIVQRAFGIVEGVALGMDCNSHDRQALVYALEMLDSLLTQKGNENG